MTGPGALDAVLLGSVQAADEEAGGRVETLQQTVSPMEGGATLGPPELKSLPLPRTRTEEASTGNLLAPSPAFAPIRPGPDGVAR